MATYGGTESGDLYGANEEVRAKSTAYKTVYEGNGNQSSDYITAKQYKGDAVYETSNSHSNLNGSWFSTGAVFPTSTYPFFHRGAHFSNENNGMFYFGAIIGALDSGGSFRLVLVP